MRHPMSVLDRLRPIGLDELTARASLLTRVDRKYVVPMTELPLLLTALAADTRVLEIEGRRQMAYESHYFDTPDLSFFRAAAHRRRCRFKVRVRTYVDDSRHLLEVKSRGARGATVKHRIPYEGPGDRLTTDDRDWVATILGDGRPAVAATLGPVLATTYHRTTLFVPATGSRATIDTDLAWRRAGGHSMTLPGYAIVETKTDHMVSDVDRLLWAARRRPESVSKYGTGLAALRPELPANHWRPVLRRYFHEACRNGICVNSLMEGTRR